MMALVGLCGYATNYLVKEKFCQLDLMQLGDGINEGCTLHILVTDSVLQNRLKLLMNKKLSYCECICTLEYIKNNLTFYLKDIEIEV